MRRTLLIIAFVALVGAAPARAHLAYKPSCGSMQCRLESQRNNLAHARYVARTGDGVHQRWARVAVGWLTRELNQTKKAMAPKRVSRSSVDPCLAEIIDRETAGTWDHTIWNGQGSGAYGLPQALPASKMASAGSDYMTNPWTQIKWMIGYVNGRYGGSCEALAYHNAHGYY